MNPITWDAFSDLLPLKDSSVAEKAAARIAFSLTDISDLHFLDHHAAKIAARLGKKPMFVFQEEPPCWMRVRIDGCCLTKESSRFLHLEEVVPYRPGLVVRWLATGTPHAQVAQAWREYQTSVDTECAVPAGSTLADNWPHLRLGLVKGVDLFHCGEFYAAHEDWESLWMRLEAGCEQSLMQGLIQLCGAHIHRLKGRQKSSQIMWEKARRNLETGAETDWIDVSQLVLTSEKALRAPLGEPIAWPTIPLVNRFPDVPRKHR
ncbi:MAG: DUF309 domain-containing protein [Blastocatellia bacterium]|nr:DUF309 domain-containing protein [Blastocatellia bacterium]